MSNYQWYFEGDSILGANQFNLHVMEEGNYSVSYLDDNGCFTISDNFLYELLVIDNIYIQSKRISKVVDLFGREVDSKLHNGILIYIYDDGSVEKFIE